MPALPPPPPGRAPSHTTAPLFRPLFALEGACTSQASGQRLSRPPDLALFVYGVIIGNNRFLFVLSFSLSFSLCLSLSSSLSLLPFFFILIFLSLLLCLFHSLLYSLLSFSSSFSFFVPPFLPTMECGPTVSSQPLSFHFFKFLKMFQNISSHVAEPYSRLPRDQFTC